MARSDETMQDMLAGYNKLGEEDLAVRPAGIYPLFVHSVGSLRIMPRQSPTELRRCDPNIS